MSYQHQQPREYYKELYDRLTVESARRNSIHYEKFYSEFERKLPKDDSLSRPGNALLLSVFYMQPVGNELLSRYEHRDERIGEWLAGDIAKDERLAEARLTEEPYCHHCSKRGLRIIDKHLMRRGDHHEPNEPEEVLFMLKCPHCSKNSVFWKDGTARVSKPTLCPKCKTEMTHKTSETKKAITITYSCPSCGHSYKDKLDLTEKKEKADPNFDKDRAHYCLWDKEFRDKLITIRRNFEDMARMGEEWAKKEKNKDVYDAISKLKKLKIGELAPLLSPAVKKEGYTEFTLDKPEMGKDVIVGFNCLDNNSDRSDYDSRKILKKTVEKALAGTNWRLIGNGVNYRLGYLNGRLRAYEREEDLRSLVSGDKS